MSVKVAFERDMRRKGAMHFAIRCVLFSVVALVLLWFRFWAMPIVLLLVALSYSIPLVLGAHWGTWEESK